MIEIEFDIADMKEASDAELLDCIATLDVEVGVCVRNRDLRRMVALELVIGVLLKEFVERGKKGH